jgi:hypothetical protein
MAFFKRNVGGQKRKRKSGTSEAKRPKKPINDDEISSSEDDEGQIVEGKHNLKNLSDEEEVYEDVKAKSARESKRVLSQLEVLSLFIQPYYLFQTDKGDAEPDEDDLDAQQLKKEDAKREQRRIADTTVIDEESVKSFRSEKLSPVCVAISNDGRFAVSCAKDGSIVKCEYFIFF